jgi:hypothetical protein
MFLPPKKSDDARSKKDSLFIRAVAYRIHQRRARRVKEAVLPALPKDLR